MENGIKVTLAILFLLCLLPMPYGYFQFVRFLAMIGFAILALSAHREGNEGLAFAFIAFAILFQPIFKIALGRTLWNVIDTMVAIWLLLTLKGSDNNKA